MKNILVIDPYTQIGGPHQVLCRIIKQLQGDGFRFFVAVPDGRTALFEQVRQVAAEVAIMPDLTRLSKGVGVNGSIKGAAALFTSSARIVRYIRARRIDLVHSVTTSCWSGGISAKLLGVPSVYHVHNLTLADRRWLSTVLGTVLSLTADRIICVSKAAQDSLPLPELTRCKSTVVFNAVDPREFHPHEGSKNMVRRSLGLPTDVPIVASVGNLDRRKGQEHFVRAAALVIKGMPQVRFVIVGGDSPNARNDGYGDRVRALARRSELSENVIFLGPRTDVHVLLQAFDLLVQPSLVEAGPLAPLEAMASGVPVIATDVGANCEEIVDGVTGILVPSRSETRLAEAITKLLEDTELRRQMAADGRNWVKTHFALETQAQMIGTIYGQLIH